MSRSFQRRSSGAVGKIGVGAVVLAHVVQCASAFSTVPPSFFCASGVSQSVVVPRHPSCGHRGHDKYKGPARPLLIPLLRSASAAIPADALPKWPEESKGSAVNKAKAVYKFTRPHTIRGTILGFLMVLTRTLMEAPNASVSLSPDPRVVLGLVSLLFGNAFIVGINQIYDVDIDKINKPDLPVASGEIKNGVAWTLVLSSLVTGCTIMRKTFSPFVFNLYSLGLLMGALYSVPPFTLKRFPVSAGLIIACVRGFILNFGVYYAARETLGLTLQWNPAVIFITRFMTVFAAVIAVTKDLPDVKGDVENNISTVASKKGVKFTASAASAVLALNYVSAIVQGSLSPAGIFNRRIMVGGHTLLLVGLLAFWRQLVPNSQQSIKTFYKRMWDLFYLEYIMYPFI